MNKRTPSSKATPVKNVGRKSTQALPDDDPEFDGEGDVDVLGGGDGDTEAGEGVSDRVSEGVSGFFLRKQRAKKGTSMIVNLPP